MLLFAQSFASTLIFPQNKPFFVRIPFLRLYFLPAALAEAGLEITFKVCHGWIVGGGGKDICKFLAGEVETFVNLAGEVLTFVNMVIDIHLVMKH